MTCLGANAGSAILMLDQGALPLSWQDETCVPLGESSHDDVPVKSDCFLFVCVASLKLLAKMAGLADGLTTLSTLIWLAYSDHSNPFSNRKADEWALLAWLDRRR